MNLSCLEVCRDQFRPFQHICRIDSCIFKDLQVVNRSVLGKRKVVTQLFPLFTSIKIIILILLQIRKVVVGEEEIILQLIVILLFPIVLIFREIGVIEQQLLFNKGLYGFKSVYVFFDKGHPSRNITIRVRSDKFSECLAFLFNIVYMVFPFTLVPDRTFVKIVKAHTVMYY